MAVISTQTRKVTDLPQIYQVNNWDNIMIHDGRGLKKVSVQTLKDGISSNVSVATSSSNGIVRPDNQTTEVLNGTIKVKTATAGSNGMLDLIIQRLQSMVRVFYESTGQRLGFQVHRRK